MKISEGETVGVELYALSDQQYRGRFRPSDWRQIQGIEPSRLKLWLTIQNEN